MNKFTAITTEIDARGVVHLTLNRPDKKNALSAQMITELTEFAGSIAKSLLRGWLCFAGPEMFFVLAAIWTG